MNNNLSQRISICLISILSVPSAFADVAISTQVITTGTEIKVLEPGPDLQFIIDNDITVGPGQVYLIKLGPGVYPLAATLKMKQFVSIAGSGVGVTVLSGAIGNSSLDEDSAVVKVVANSSLSDLSVENTGSGDYSSGIFNTSSVLIQNVSATVSGAAKGNFGIYNAGGSTTMVNIVTTVSGTVSEENYGVYNTGSSPLMVNVVANALGEPTNFGVYNVGSFPTMSNVQATASGGTNNTGVANIGGSSPSMNNVTATASLGTADNKGVFNSTNSSPNMANVNAIASGPGGSLNWGVFHFDATSIPRIARSVLSGSTDAMHFGGSTGTRISDTQLIGGIDADPTGTQCRNTYDENLGDVAC